MHIRMSETQDLDKCKKLLKSSSLPAEFSLEDFKHFFIAESSENEIIGLIGVQFDNSEGLLRSLVVSSKSRGRGIGTNLVRTLEQYAISQNIKSLLLLTSSADNFFERLGYQVISRSNVSEFIKQTTEFSSICPDSSICMKKNLVKSS